MSPCIAFFLNNEWRCLEVIISVIRGAQYIATTTLELVLFADPVPKKKSNRPWPLYSNFIQSSGGIASSLGKSLCPRWEVRQTLFFLWLQFQPLFSAGSNHYLMSFPMEAAGKLEEG